MEKATASKSVKNRSGILEIYTYSGSRWHLVTMDAEGIGKIRMKDNLKVLGTSDIPLILPNVEADAASHFFDLKVGNKTFNLDFAPGRLLLVFKAGTHFSAWTNARDMKVKG
jgi:hypothetical protein